MRTEREILDTIIQIAKEDERVRAAYMHGSRINPNAEKDKYSDYDIGFIVTEIDSFLNDREWINNFGNITFAVEMHGMQNTFEMRERHNLSHGCHWMMFFKDGSQIDLSIQIIDETTKHSSIYNKPGVVLLDKDGYLPELNFSSDSGFLVEKPQENRYSACCTGFWWNLSYVAKAIAREQLPYAKEHFHFVRFLLLSQMIEWYIGVHTDFSVPLASDRQHRYYKKYLPVDVYDLYTKIYSDSNYDNFWSAVFSTCELFSKLAVSVGDYLSFTYNKQEEENMMDYLIKVKNGTL